MAFSSCLETPLHQPVAIHLMVTPDHTWHHLVTHRTSWSCLELLLYSTVKAILPPSLLPPLYRGTYWPYGFADSKHVWLIDKFSKLVPVRYWGRFLAARLVRGFCPNEQTNDPSRRPHLSAELFKMPTKNLRDKWQPKQSGSSLSRDC